MASLPLPQAIPMPARLLRDPKVPPSAKLLWAWIWLGHLGVAGLANASGFTPNTVRSGLKRLLDEGWLGATRCRTGGSTSYRLTPITGRYGNLPVHLLRQRKLHRHAGVVYCCLQLVSSYIGGTSVVRLNGLRRFCGIAHNTAKGALLRLEGNGWVEVEQTSRVAPLEVTLKNPWIHATVQEIERMRTRINNEEFHGEGLTEAWINLLVATDEYHRYARPKWAMNPLSGMLMQCDWLFPALKVIVEFNGPQHYQTTPLHSSERDLQYQKVRDLAKTGQAYLQGYDVIHLRAQDLNRDRMEQKLGKFLPLRALTENDELKAEYLNWAGQVYLQDLHEAIGELV